MMRVAVAAFAALIALGMAWRGYRRGALATLLGWLPIAAAVLILVLAVRAAWSDLEHFAATCQSGALAALAVYLGGIFLLRRRPRHLAAVPAGAPDCGLRNADCGLGTQGRTPRAEALLPSIRNPQSAIRNPSAARRGLARLNRLAGAALGLLCSAVLCLGLACLASTVPFSMAAAEPPAGPRRAPPPKWVGTVREACTDLADIADFGLVRYIPLLKTYGSEVHALIRVLNAPQEKLGQLARRRGLADLAELPEIQDALIDDGYQALIARLGGGDLTAIPGLARSPVTRKVLACPQIRDAIRGLTPSRLAADLEPKASPSLAADAAAGAARNP